MSHTPKSLIISMLLLSLTQIIGMENPATLNNCEIITSPFVTLPNELATTIIAQCKAKDLLRQTCKHFSKLASSKTNKGILIHPKLWLKQTVLNLFLLEYGAVGETNIVRNLLDKGADPNIWDDHYMTVMHYAAECGDLEVAKLLLDSPTLITTNIAIAANSPYWLAVNNGHTDIIAYFVKKDVIDVSGLGEHLIAAVAKRANNKNRSINVNEKYRYYGDTPLYRACLGGCFYYAKILLQQGAEINGKDNFGLTLLHWASGKGYFHIVSLLLHNGANVNEKDKEGSTPLHLASGKGHFQHINTFLCRNSVASGLLQVVRILLRYGANVNQKNHNGKTPLDKALSGGHEVVADLLKQHGGKRSHELHDRDEKCAIQ